ncbi:MAG: glycosyltransferase family 4 protein [Rhodospirillales bacterium]|nr:glycosyltransferase family 4 protein [Rhodospirillales bacterium]MCB9964673.1 glycosyltransferase family 4 protein [Rhodospirillales bacterium]MCB9979963.1 glycosyltransferase family 4 protein [Rhodospirillales bacterium]
MINRVFPPTVGATGRLLYELATYLSGEGYQVTVLTTGPQAMVRKEPYGVEIIRIKSPRNPRSMIGNMSVSLRLFFKALTLPKPDILLTKTDPPFFVIFGAMISKTLKVKHIHWSQDVYPDILPALDYKIPRGLYRMLDYFTARSMRSCDAVVAIGACMKQVLLRKVLFEEIIHIIPNWTDRILLKEDASKEPKHHDNKHELTDEERAALPAKFRILYAGNMGRAHPYQTILDAARILNRTEHDIEFLFVGSNQKLFELAKIRARERLENIRFLPYQPRRQLKGLLESGDLHIISMADEAHGKMLPSRIYDIFTVKRPCLFIGGEESDLFVMLETMQAGITIPQGRADFLANTIRHLRDNGEAWHALYKGAEAAREKYTPDLSLEMWKDLIERLP